MCQCVAVHCSALQCIAVHCSALQCIAVHCSALQYIAVHCSALQCIAVHCSALQCIAVHCSTLQCVAVHCSALQCLINTHTFLQGGVSVCQWDQSGEFVGAGAGASCLILDVDSNHMQLFPSPGDRYVRKCYSARTASWNSMGVEPGNQEGPGC